MCPVCYWEDDGQDDFDADIVRGGPNKNLSLTEARNNFAEFGASDLLYIGEVRAPLPSEHLEIWLANYVFAKTSEPKHASDGLSPRAIQSK